MMLVFSISPFILKSQKKVSFRDSLDHKLDLSEWVVTAKGFIPIPYLITEPALGGIGGALIPVFIKPNAPHLDSVHGRLVKTRVKPNIYAAGAAYTANGSWMCLVAATGAIRKWRAHYRLGTGLADINMYFYREVFNQQEESFEFNIRTIPVFGQITKQIGKSPWSTGLNYLFLKTDLKRTNAKFHTPKEVSSMVSRIGVVLDFDSRDNVFTPNKGFKWNTMVASSAEEIGSDYDFTSASSAIFWYLPVTKRIISGFRTEYQQIWGEPPFYMKPFITLRGIPIMRYQGNITALAETEWRWDLTKRHSAVAFAGAGKAITGNSTFQESSWRAAGGAGWRYLIARKLNLRMGIDIARGPEQWAYYVVFGTNWVR